MLPHGAHRFVHFNAEAFLLSGSVQVCQGQMRSGDGGWREVGLDGMLQNTEGAFKGFISPGPHNTVTCGKNHI